MSCHILYYNMMCNRMIWYDILSYDVIWHDIIWYGAISRDFIYYIMVWYEVWTVDYDGRKEDTTNKEMETTEERRDDNSLKV